MGKSQTLLASAYTYSGTAGFSGVATGATIAGYYTYAASYDNDLRLSNATYKLKSSGATYYSASRGYDGVGNVISTATTLTSGTDTQAFCYDEQNRLVWASAASGTPPCGGSLTGGTLTSAQYTASYSYDTLGRLTSAPLGSYTYGDPNHLDAATSVGATYSASYDAAGDMTCRAPTNTVTCAGTPTGSVMTYDNERRLATWQNTPSNPTSTAAYWYDGEGNRVAQTLNGVTTYYVGNDEEVTGSTLLKYYHIPGLPVLGTITGVTRTYLASDGLGSETVDLSYNGSVLATALYGPYGVGRYATGTMPTSRGYTGQRQDSGSGLDYYVSRYYDPLLAQFASADSFVGSNAYAYTDGNPCTFDDPSGHCAQPKPSTWKRINQVRQAISAIWAAARMHLLNPPVPYPSRIPDPTTPTFQIGAPPGDCGNPPVPPVTTILDPSYNPDGSFIVTTKTPPNGGVTPPPPPPGTSGTWELQHLLNENSMGNFSLDAGTGPANLQWLYNRNMMNDWNPDPVSTPAQQVVQAQLRRWNDIAESSYGTKYGDLSPAQQSNIQNPASCNTNCAIQRYGYHPTNPLSLPAFEEGSGGLGAVFDVLEGIIPALG